MYLTNHVLRKRIHPRMRGERAAKSVKNLFTNSLTFLQPRPSRDKQPFRRPDLYPIAVRLDTGLPQGARKCKSSAPRARKARKIGRKSKTHKANHLPS
jgi:hypothetical protein